MESQTVQDNKENKDSSSIKQKLLIVIIAFILGVLFDYFFYDHSIGISYFIFNFLLIGFFIYCNKENINFKKRSGYIVLTLIFLLSARLCIYSNQFLSVLDMLFVPFLIVAYTIIVTKDDLDWSRPEFLVDMADRILVKSISNMFKPFVLIKKNIKSRRPEIKNKMLIYIITGLLISLPVLIIVIPLLASADMAFGYYINNIANIFEYMNSGDSLTHVIIILLVFLYVLGYAWSFKYQDIRKISSMKSKEGNVEPLIIITALFIINIVYLLFTIIQFSYLYAGDTLPGALTYSEYARKGFFELVTVTVINLIIMLISIYIIKKDNIMKCKVVSLLLTLLTCFTINMLISAYYRMHLYESSYGYTELRIYVQVFMLFMLVVFTIAMIKLWIKNIPLFKASFVCGIIFFTVLNYINVDGLVAHKNIERYKETGKIDIQYLSSLSYDAIPEILKQVANDKSLSSVELKEWIKSKLQTASDNYIWIEFNYSRSRVIELMDSSQLF